MVSKKHKTIFIHIEKTGGTSIEQKLGLFQNLQRGVQDHKKLRYYEHISATSYSLKSLIYFVYNFKRKKYKKSSFYLKNVFSPLLSKQEFSSYFKFTIVRNTWDRIYSYYYHIMRDEYLKRVNGINNECSLFEFVQNHLDYKNFNQLDYITDSKGNIPLDFIGRFENLCLDFNQICNKLDIQNKELPRLLMDNKKPNYREKYNKETKDLVQEIFKSEIEYFGFKF